MSIAESTKKVYEASIKRLVGLAGTVDLYDTPRW